MKKNHVRKNLKSRNRLKGMMAFTAGFLGLAIVLTLTLGAVTLFANEDAAASPAGEVLTQQDQLPKALAYVGLGLAVGLGSIGAGIALGPVAAAALGVITEKPEMMGRSFIFIGLAEGIAIYGILFAFLIMNAFK
jgi:V/A-type H+-transporting ATPase subunit K